MTRVLLVVNDLRPYGSQRVAVTLAKSLLELGVDVELLTIEPAADGDLELPAAISRRSVERSSGGARGYAELVLRVRAELRASNADVVMSHMIFSNVISLAARQLLPRRRRRPILVTEHNRPSANLQIERSPGALAALARLLYPRSNAIVGVSQAVVDDTAATFKLRPSRITCILNPVDVEAVRAEAASPLDADALNLFDGAPTIVCVGAFRRAKGQDVLVRALAELPDARLILVGDGSLADDVRQLAADLGLGDRVVFSGYRSDARAFMAHASVVAVPSRWEGFGLVAVEAAAVGRPVVGSAVSGLSELVPRHVPGELVPPDDPGQLAAALARALATGPSGTAPDLAAFEPHRVAASYLAAIGLERGA